MKSLGNNLYQFILPYSDYPEGFKELVKDEKEWQKWVSVAPDDNEEYNYINGNNVVGLISDMSFQEDTFTFIYQDMACNPDAMETMKFFARAVVVAKTPEETPKMYQLICFDCLQSEWPDPLKQLKGNGIMPGWMWGRY